MSLSGVLQELAVKEEQTKLRSDAAKSIRSLKIQKKALDERQNRLKQKIATGGIEDENTAPSATPPASVSQQMQSDILNLFNLNKNKQKLEGQAYLTGMTVSQQDTGDLIIMFDPYIQGQPAGVFTIRMGPRYSLLETSLPSAVPVRSIYKHHLDSGKLNSRQSLKPFLTSVFRHLRGYLSRKTQLEELKVDDDLAHHIREVQHSPSYTNIKIVLSITDRGKDQKDVRIEISLKYAPDGERPLEDSIQIDASNEWEDSIGYLEEQCNVLYTTRLRDGLLTAFLENDD